MSGSGNGQMRSGVDAVKRFLRQFGRGEAGGAVILSLFFILILLMVVGYAIDTTRFENKRARLQATLDRAVLAAASLSQALPCEEVVRDYFDKAGFSDAVGTITCKQSDMGRTAEVTAELEMTTLLMEGTEKLTAPASGSAVETVSDIEIVLVVDITGSMGTTKLNNLKLASQNFVQEVLERDVDNRVSIAVVPFHDNVNISPWLMNAYSNVFARNEYNPLVACIDLPASVWSSTAIPPDQVMPLTTSWDRFSSNSSGGDWYAAPIPDNPNRPTSWWYDYDVRTRCPGSSTATASSVLSLPSQDIAALQSQLGALRTGGFTTMGHIGLKWGVALLDPSMRPIYDRAIDEGRMPATLRGRPYDFGRDKTLKIVVFMTDGANGARTWLRPEYYAGPSGIYVGSDGNYAIFHPSRSGANKYYTPHTDNARDAGIGRPFYPVGPAIPPGTPLHDGWRADPSWPGSGTVRQLDWVEVWRTFQLQWLTWQLYARPLGNDNYDQMRDVEWSMYDEANPSSWFIPEEEGVDSPDERTRTTCNLAKEAGITVFSIAYMAGARAQALLMDCATSPSHFYEPEGAEIMDAFDSIANQISMLRLTQ
jgi:Flp pilus assembly protein TadG